MRLTHLFERVPTTQAEYEAANAADDAADRKRLQRELETALLNGDDEKADEIRSVLKDMVSESTHPDVAKKQREKQRLLAAGYSKDHPAVQKVEREIQRLIKATKV